MVDILNYLGLPLLVVYVASMFVYPWLDGRGSWIHVQAVWDRWQTFNAGALAFLASMVAFNIARFNENLQRERDFVAAKAYLPSTLSGLMEYCSQCSHVFAELWTTNGTPAGPINTPTLPSDYREVFSNCIRHAAPEIGTYLSTILVRLQVHEARLRDVLAEVAAGRSPVIDRYTLISYLYRLGQIYALIGNLFEFARGEGPFKGEHLVWEDYRNAFGVMGIETDDIFIDEKMNLKAFTVRAVERAYASRESGSASDA